MPRHALPRLTAILAPLGALAVTAMLLGCEPEASPAPIPAADRAPDGATTGAIARGTDGESDAGDTGGIDLEASTLITTPGDEAIAEAAKTHLDAGRKLTRKGAYRRAMAELELGLELEPTNPYLWSEHGWAAFRAGELDTAKASTNKALEFATKERARASMLYNLGRIAEKRGDLNDAAGYYEQSLRYRPNKTVKKRLGKVEARLDAAEG